MIGLDANTTPEELTKWATPLLTKAGAKVVATSKPTHISEKGASRCIDFFLVDEKLVDLVTDVRKIGDVETAPHRVVSLRFKKSESPMRQWVMRGPNHSHHASPSGAHESQSFRPWKAKKETQHSGQEVRRARTN